MRQGGSHHSTRSEYARSRGRGASVKVWIELLINDRKVSPSTKKCISGPSLAQRKRALCAAGPASPRPVVGTDVLGLGLKPGLLRGLYATPAPRLFAGRAHVRLRRRAGRPAWRRATVRQRRSRGG